MYIFLFRLYVHNETISFVRILLNCCYKHSQRWVNSSRSIIWVFVDLWNQICYLRNDCIFLWFSDIKFIYVKNVHVIMFQIQLLKYTKTNTNPLFIRRGMSVHISIKTVSQKIISLTKINFNHKILWSRYLFYTAEKVRNICSHV